MSFRKAADDGDVKQGSALRVELDGKAIALVRNPEGKLFALDDICSHEDASLSEGFVENTSIECPRHCATFDLESGKAMALPAIEAIGTYEVKVENGEILVNIT